MNLYRWIIAIIGGTAILLGGVFLFLIFSDINEQQQKAQEQAKEQEKFEEKVEAVSVDEDNLPTESFFQDMLHKMTHQKVRSDEKWAGHLRITDERIAEMQAVLNNIEGTSKEYDHFDFYERTLKAWGRGDFDNAVEVHNTIWDWKGGSVGKAKGLLSKAEEKQYIETHFE